MRDRDQSRREPLLRELDRKRRWKSATTSCSGQQLIDRRISGENNSGWDVTSRDKGMDEVWSSSASLQDLSAAEYSRLSALWDDSIEMAPGEREAWLAALERSEPKVAALLRVLSASQDESRNRGFLETNDFLAAQVSALVDADPGLIGRNFGPYRVLELLGHRGMGSVWLAERADGLFARKVALKLIHPMLKSRVTSERFAREREILASLNHTNIARLIDAGFAEDGQPYLALDYVAGTPITTYSDGNRLTVHERLALFRQVLSAVQYAHAHLVIHRDLKPANILVTPAMRGSCSRAS
jgi:eukaryotic-like serine/threonine-protein kinase